MTSTSARLGRALVSQFHRPHGFWGAVAGFVMAHRRSNVERSRLAIARLGIEPGDRVLEVGFGPGVAIARIAEQARPGTVVGVDHSDSMVRRARRRNARAVREGRVELVWGALPRLPDLGAPFDRVLAVNVLQFLDDAVEGLVALRGVMRPGGRIAITHQPRARGATDADARRAGERLRSELAAAGFSDVRVETLELAPVAAICVLGSA